MSVLTNEPQSGRAVRHDGWGLWGEVLLDTEHTTFPSGRCFLQPHVQLCWCSGLARYVGRHLGSARQPDQLWGGHWQIVAFERATKRSLRQPRRAPLPPAAAAAPPSLQPAKFTVDHDVTTYHRAILMRRSWGERSYTGGLSKQGWQRSLLRLQLQCSTAAPLHGSALVACCAAFSHVVAYTQRTTDVGAAWHCWHAARCQILRTRLWRPSGAILQGFIWKPDLLDNFQGFGISL